VCLFQVQAREFSLRFEVDFKLFSFDAVATLQCGTVTRRAWEHKANGRSELIPKWKERLVSSCKAEIQQFPLLNSTQQLKKTFQNPPLIMSFLFFCVKSMIFTHWLKYRISLELRHHKNRIVHQFGNELQ
jgi:hypothetical protein